MMTMTIVIRAAVKKIQNIPAKRMPIAQTKVEIMMIRMTMRRWTQTMTTDKRMRKNFCSLG